MKKTLMTVGIASAMMMLTTSCQQTQRENPLLVESQLPFGAPDFSKIKVTDYLPAFEAAIEQQRANIQQIVECTDSATFANTTKFSRLKIPWSITTQARLDAINLIKLPRITL